MASIHPTMTRLYAAFSEVARASNPRAKIGQSALARRLNTSPQRVKNWESRGISQRGANKAQELLGVNATWILNGTGPTFAAGAETSTPSQSLTPNPDILHEAVTLLLFDLEHGGPRPARSASDLVLDLYRRIEAAGGRLPRDEELAFELAARSRKQGGSHGNVQAGKGRANR